MNEPPLTRRKFLQTGAIAASGIALTDTLEASQRSTGRAKRCIVLLLTGGPSQCAGGDTRAVRVHCDERHWCAHQRTFASPG
jgi:uncharacterized protein (DUF1501 family)